MYLTALTNVHSLPQKLAAYVFTFRQTIRVFVFCLIELTSTFLLVPEVVLLGEQLAESRRQYSERLTEIQVLCPDKRRVVPIENVCPD